MIATVRRCDLPKCGKEIAVGCDFYALSVTVAKERNERVSASGEGPFLSSVPQGAGRASGKVEVCSQGCATSLLASMLDGAQP